MRSAAAAISGMRRIVGTYDGERKQNTADRYDLLRQVAER
jgi:hypothetical protein